MTEKMSKGRLDRAGKIDALKEIFQDVQGGVLTDYRGLRVDEITDLRNRFRDKGINYKVVKNTLASLAAQGTQYEGVKDILKGPIGIAYTQQDPIMPAKVAVDFAKDHAALEIRGGYMEGTLLSADQVVEVSKMPGKMELMAQFLSVLNGPSQRFLGVLNGTCQKFLGVLKARSEQLEGN